MDFWCFQRIKGWAKDLNMKITQGELENICKHFGGSAQLVSTLERYGKSNLLFFRTIVKHYQECPVTLASKVTPPNGDCMHIGLKDGAKFSPPLQKIDLKKMFYTEMMWDKKKKPRENVEIIDNDIYDDLDTTCCRRKMNGAAMALFSGHCSKPAETCDWNHHNIKPADMTTEAWEGFWKLIMEPGVFDLPSKLGPLAGDISDAQITLAAHFLRSHILIFDGEMKRIVFIDGNYFKPGNVESDFPFLLGRSRDHYQTLIPDDRHPEAYAKIRDYVHEMVFDHETGEAVMKSIKDQSSSDEDETIAGPLIETISGKLIIYQSIIF